MADQLTTYQLSYKVAVGGYDETLTINRVGIFKNEQHAVEHWFLFADQVRRDHLTAFSDRSVTVVLWGLTKIC